MALRAVSIVNLEGSIRAQFDQRVNEIQRSIREQEENTTHNRENENQDIENAEDGPTENNTNNTNNNNNDAEVPDMTEDGDLGRAPEDRSRSVDICVDYDAFPEVDAASISGDSINNTLNEEIRRLSSRDTRNMSCCQFYRQHWVGHMVTGVLSGCLFIVLGIIFLVNNDDLPVYAGVTLIILGLAPCCMAMNRYRYARLYERERQRALHRLGAIRTHHRRHLRDERSRNRQVYPDNPPAYDNLGYGSGDERGEAEDHDTDSSREVPFVLPTYDQCIKKEEDQGSVKAPSTIEDFAGEDAFDIIAPGNPNTNNNSNNDQPPAEQDDITAINIDSEQFEVIAIDNNIEIIESHFVDDETQNDGDSGATSPGHDNVVFESDTIPQA